MGHRLMQQLFKTECSQGRARASLETKKDIHPMQVTYNNTRHLSLLNGCAYGNCGLSELFPDTW